MSTIEKGSEVTFSHSERSSLSTLSSGKEGLEETFPNTENGLEAEPAKYQCTLLLDSSGPETPKTPGSGMIMPDHVMKIPGMENLEQLCSDFLITPQSGVRDSVLIL